MIEPPVNSNKKQHRQRRRVRKDAYIRVKNVLRRFCVPGYPQFAVAECVEKNGIVHRLEYCFLHTSKRMALRGEIVTADYAWKKELMDQVRHELNSSHPLPKNAVRLIDGQPMVEVYGHSYDVWIDDKWELAALEREEAGVARMEELLRAPCPITPMSFVMLSPYFAAVLSSVVDSESVCFEQVDQAIAQFRSHGEPICNLVGWRPDGTLVTYDNQR